MVSVAQITPRNEPVNLDSSEEPMKTSITYVSMAGGTPRAPLMVRIHDSSKGTSARGVPVFLAMKIDQDTTWDPVEEGVTNSDGVAAMLYHVTLPQNALYKLEINAGRYFAASGQDACCQKVETTFRLAGKDKQRQISIHLSPAGYSLHIGC